MASSGRANSRLRTGTIDGERWAGSFAPAGTGAPTDLYGENFTAAYGGATTVRSAVLKLLRTFQSYDECREVVPSALRSERLIVAHPC